MSPHTYRSRTRQSFVAEDQVKISYQELESFKFRKCLRENYVLVNRH